jgi:hypothetical protein
VFWYALAILLLGLLPGEGYMVVRAMLWYTLFFDGGSAMVVVY